MQRAEFNFAGVTSDLPVLRARLRAIFRTEGWTAEEQTDILLAVGELATNAVMHAGTCFNVVCTVNGVVTVEVEDGNPQELPSPRARHSTGTGGFGLRIVDRIAREWTVEVRDHTKLVRAVFDRPRTSSAPSEPSGRGRARPFSPDSEGLPTEPEAGEPGVRRDPAR